MKRYEDYEILWRLRTLWNREQAVNITCFSEVQWSIADMSLALKVLCELWNTMIMKYSGDYEILWRLGKTMKIIKRSLAYDLEINCFDLWNK